MSTDVTTSHAERIAVLLDFQNVHLVGRDRFAGGIALQRCVPNPVKIADLIASSRRRPSVAAPICVSRGRPAPHHQPLLSAANYAQASQWTYDNRVIMAPRQLNYRGWPSLP